MPEQMGSVDSKTDRQIAEEEAESDLHKPLRQLLVDVHHEIILRDRTIPENVAHASKRIASIMVRVADLNEQTAKRLNLLTLILVILTALLVLLTIGLFYLTIKLIPA